MRIAFFTDSFWPELGGIQDSVLTTARTLARRGHEILILAPSFSARDCALAGVSGELPPHERMRIFRCASVHVPSSTLQSRFAIPTGQRWTVVREFRPDVIHVHTFLTLGWEGVRAARKLGVPLIGTNHWAIAAFIGSPWLARRAARYVSWFYNHCAHVTAPSASVITDMHKNGLCIPSSVVSNPIDTEQFSPASDDDKAALKKKLGLPGMTVTYAGRLAPEKKIDVVMKAVARMCHQFPDLTLALAGHGSARGDLERLATSLKIADRVRFVGTLSPPALSDLFRVSDLFAIASTSETQSMTLLQAMACGLPAVVVDSLALPEYVTHEETGMIAPPDDDQQMSECLAELLGDTKKRLAFGEDAARRVREGFGVETVTETLLEIYGRLLK